jgi:hypothetical protein
MYVRECDFRSYKDTEDIIADGLKVEMFEYPNGIEW